MIYSVIYRHGDVHWIEEVEKTEDIWRVIVTVTGVCSEGDKAQKICELMEVGDEFKAKNYKIECRKESMIRK